MLPAKRKSDGSENPLFKKRQTTEAVSTASTSNHLPPGHNGPTVWTVQWRAPQYKKHKTWDGDGILVIERSLDARLYDSDGKPLSSGKATLPLEESTNLTVGSKDVELERAIPHSDYLSGRCFGRYNQAISTPAPEPRISQKKFRPPAVGFKAPGPSSNGSSTVTKLASATEEAPSSLVLGRSTSHWTANWRKPQEKKNKTWDGDAYVICMGMKLHLISEKGKVMGTIPWKGEHLTCGFTAFINGKEVVLDAQIPASQLPPISSLQVDTSAGKILSVDQEDTEKSASRFIPPLNFYAAKSSAKSNSALASHDPNVPDSLVMKAPTKEHVKKFNRRNLDILPVVVDPILSRKMRDHQKEGVKFLYECVMGLRKHEGQGCILADEMGLGKTLQTIALVWTLLKQNPYAAPLPTVQKVLIVCPVSLVNNWKAEFQKWLGRDRVGILVCDKKKGNVDLFATSKVHQVMIMGYERLRTVVHKLTDIYPPVGLIVCDEGHRLKSTSSKTVSAFKSLPCRRRIILSGTPIQNNLEEFHAMAEFCNPGLLDEYSMFRRNFEGPILKSRTPDASPKEIELGQARSEQLLRIAKSFVLRRDATLLKNHLPPKTEYVVFISPTELQLAMFSKILNPDKLDNIIQQQKSVVDALPLIQTLVKIGNSPVLLKATADSAKKKGDSSSAQLGTVEEAAQLLPQSTQISDLSVSGKLHVLERMLRFIRQNTQEKCVLVSHFTSTLNILEAYCKKSSYSYYRLDGQTPQGKRQDYVNAFNRSDQRGSFIFLLSSKAGGTGINLIGASRLFLLDSDWNPSHDLQSMARCHRDGQKRPVFIYRFLTAGTIDEKIYQRQVTKLALSESFIGTGSNSSKTDAFARQDLVDIFRVHPNTGCNTHDLLGCPCDQPGYREDDDGDTESDDELEQTDTVLKRLKRLGSGFMSASTIDADAISAMDKAYLRSKRDGLASLGEWKHINCLRSSDHFVHDEVLRRVINGTTMDDDSESMSEQQGSDVEKVPPASVTFLFEKAGTVHMSTGDDEDS